MACFGAPSHDTWAARGEHHEYPARVQRSGPSGVGRRKPMFSEVRRGTGRPQISARTRAMMLMMLTGRPHRRLPRTRAAQAGRDACARMHIMLARAGRAGGEKGERGGGGGARARARVGPPPLSARSSLPPAQ